MSLRRPVTRVALALAFLAVAGVSRALDTAPIDLSVDAREAPRRIFHVTESIPAGAGALTLVYPKWIPGEHGPTGPITDLVGIRISKGGRPVAWARNPIEMWSISCDVPAGPGPLEVAFDYVAPLSAWTTADVTETLP